MESHGCSQKNEIENDLAELIDSPGGMEDVIYLHQIQPGEIREYYDLSNERFLVARRVRLSR